jgi:hypothetical protein
MYMTRMVHYGLLILVVISTACSMPAYTKAAQPIRSLASGLEGSFDRTLTVAGVVDLDVSTGSGSIAIRQGSNGRVEIHGRIYAGENWRRSDAGDAIRRIESNPPIEQSGQTIRIGRLSGRDGERNISISYEIAVPAQSNVRSHTGSGSQTIEGISGPVESGTGSGSITLRNINGDVTANTGSGSIRGTGLRSGLRAHTGSGRIEVEGQQTGRWDLETGSGSVDIRLPRDAGFELNAHTGSGGVSVNYPMTVQGQIGRRQRDVTGKVGSGLYALNVRTGSGHVRIE